MADDDTARKAGHPHRGEEIDWGAQPLGRVPDSEIARRLGVNVGSVLQARRTRGIAAYAKGGKRTRRAAATTAKPSSAIDALRALPAWRERSARRVTITVDGVGKGPVVVTLEGAAARGLEEQIAALLRHAASAELEGERRRLAEAERMIEELGR